jgi:hypothetical protein
MPTSLDSRLIGALACSLALAYPESAGAQRRQVHAYDMWSAISGEQQLGGAWAGSLNIEHRRSDVVRVPRQMNFTGTLLRDFAGSRLGFGLAHYHTSSNDDFGPARPQNERRVFEQLGVSHRLFGAQWSHRFRYEQRWLGADPLPGAEREWVYTSRVRHQIRVVRPLDGRSNAATRLYVIPSLEGFVRTTDRRGLLVEQMRAGVTAGLGIAPRINVEAGYQRQTTIRTDQVREVHDVLQVAARVIGHARH